MEVAERSQVSELPAYNVLSEADHHQAVDTFLSVFKVNLDYQHPEEKLCLALLDDAIKFLNAKNKFGMPTEEAIEARRWIMNESEDWVFNFNPVCEVLGLHPGAARQAILKRAVRTRRQSVVSRSGARPIVSRAPPPRGKRAWA
jgi:hypothetical protein